MTLKDDVPAYLERFEHAPPEQLLKYFLAQLGDRIVLASSLGAEDQVLTHMALKILPTTRIFVLDTGRLPQETYDVMTATMKAYNFSYETYFPDSHQVEEMVRQKGPNLFYDSVENRKLCCHVRKVAPLKRVLSTCDAWITGLRRAQAPNRASLQAVEWDATTNHMKLNPLVAWTDDAVWDYIRSHKIPYNKLHDSGYPSIGCACCTRAIKPGEPIRAGRWWWESPEHKECGLHIKNGKAFRTKDLEPTDEPA